MVGAECGNNHRLSGHKFQVTEQAKGKIKSSNRYDFNYDEIVSSISNEWQKSKLAPIYLMAHQSNFEILTNVRSKS